MDRVYMDDELDFFLKPIQDKLDRHVLGMKLEEAVETFEKRKITNQEMFNGGSVPVPLMTRLQQALMGSSFLDPEIQKEVFAKLLGSVLR